MSVVAKRKYFGTDGIREIANGLINPQLVIRVGMAVALMFKNGHQQRVLIGKDTRVSGYMIEYGLVCGLTAAGAHVTLVGPMPTPGIGVFVPSMRMDMGIMISASHNSFEYNGIKIFGPDGFKLSDEQEAKIEVLMDSFSDSEVSNLPTGKGLGRAKRDDDASGRYIEFAKNTFPKGLRLDGLRVVIDCANGAAYKVAPEVLHELGAEVVSIGVDPDGFNINEKCGSTAPEALVAKVRETRADIGIALDGDADRVILVDEHGRKVDGDQVVAVIAESWKRSRRLNRAGVVMTVMSNLNLERHLKTLGIKTVRCPVGDRYVIEAMRANGCNLGGEQSGHVIMSDYTTTGDGLVAALQVLAVVKKSGKSVSEVAHRFEPLPQFAKNLPCKQAREVIQTRAVKAAIRSSEKKLGKEGRLIIRPSGTEPVLRVMIESSNKKLSGVVMKSITDAVQKA